jgi:hypothetical protein
MMNMNPNPAALVQNLIAAFETGIPRLCAEKTSEAQANKKNPMAIIPPSKSCPAPSPDPPITSPRCSNVRYGKARKSRGFETEAKTSWFLQNQ